jgi:hypothetical protein
MSNYTLRFIDPDNATKTLGDSITTVFEPKVGDRHPIGNVIYTVTDVTLIKSGPNTEAHLRVKAPSES